MDSAETGDVLDIYAAAGMPQPALSDLTPEFVRKAQEADNPQLAIEALRKLVLTESRKATRSNVIRQRMFSEGVAELMFRYTNQQLTSAQVIAELVKLAREVAAEASGGSGSPRSSARTNWRSTTRSRRTSRPSRSRERTCSPRSPATSSRSCSVT